MSMMQPDPQSMGMGAAFGALPEQEQLAPPETDTAMSGTEHLRLAIEHAQAALVDEPDDADSQALAKVVSGLYQIFAARQKESDQTMGNPTLLRTLRRSGA